MFKRILTAATVVAMASVPAQAQQLKCGEYEKVTTILEEKYGEQRAFVGPITNGNVVFALYLSVKTGTWSIIAVQSNGTACLLAAGVDGEMLEVEPAGEPI